MYVDSKMELVHDVFTWTLGPVARQFAYTLAERDTGFNHSFKRLMKLSGFSEQKVACTVVSKEEKKDVESCMRFGEYQAQRNEIECRGNIDVLGATK